MDLRLRVRVRVVKAECIVRLGIGICLFIGFETKTVFNLQSQFQKNLNVV